MKLATIIFADLPGIENASWPSCEVIFYAKNVFVAWTGGFIFCDQIYCNFVKKVILGYLSSVEGKSELLLFLCDKGHIGQCISLYLCSFLSTGKVVLLGNKSMLIIGVLVYHVLLLIPCTSMFWGSWQPRITGVSLWHVWKAVLLHVWRDQSHALVSSIQQLLWNTFSKRISLLHLSEYFSPICWQGFWCSVFCFSDNWCCSIWLWYEIIRWALLSCPTPGVKCRSITVCCR